MRRTFQKKVQDAISGGFKNMFDNIKQDQKQNATKGKAKVRPGEAKPRKGLGFTQLTRVPKPNRPTRYYRAILNQYHSKIYRYIRSLFFPEDAVMGQFAAKQASLVNIPTSTVAFKEQLYFQSGDDGNFNLIWVPNYFSTKTGLATHVPQTQTGTVLQYGHLYLSNSDFFPSTGDPFPRWVMHTSYCPDMALTKYRLVSAKLVVEYNGPIIQKGGALQSCALYNDIPVFAGEFGVGQEDVLLNSSSVNPIPVNELNNYTDMEAIRNGLWNQFKNISSTQTNKVEVLALPSDPTDHTFFPMAHYYSVVPRATQENSLLRYAKSTDGGHLSYVVKGTGIKTSEGQPAAMIATVYYNFEIIADQSTAPFLRAKIGIDEDDPLIVNTINNAMPKIADLVREYNAAGKTFNTNAINNMINDFLRQQMDPFNVFTKSSGYSMFKEPVGTRWYNNELF